MTMTNQEAFNKAVRGLAAQGFQRAMQCAYTCAYRDGEGRRCAVGHLLSDEELAVEGNSQPVYELQTPFEEGGSLNGLDSMVLENLQGAHDTSTTPIDMKSRLVEFAIRYELELPRELDQAQRARAHGAE